MGPASLQLQADTGLILWLSLRGPSAAATPRQTAFWSDGPLSRCRRDLVCGQRGNRQAHSRLRAPHAREQAPQAREQALQLQRLGGAQTRGPDGRQDGGSQVPWLPPSRGQEEGRATEGGHSASRPSPSRRLRMRKSIPTPLSDGETETQRG